MYIRKKILPLILSFLLIIPTFLYSCGKDTGDDTVGGDTEVSVEKTLIDIISGGKSDYIILRSDSAPQEEIDAALSLRKKIESVFGVKLRIMNDLDEIKQNAIIVGNVNHPSSKAVFEKLKYKDFAIAMQGKDLVICGGNSKRTLDAVKKFTEDYLTGSASTLSVPSDLYDLNAPEYKAGNVILCSKDIADFQIVTSSYANRGELFEAYALQKFITDSFGVYVDVVDDGENTGAECEILIGDVQRDFSADYESKLNSCKDSGIIYFEGTRIYLGGNSTASVRDAVRTFISKCLGQKPGEDGKLTVPSDTVLAVPDSPTYKVMSFNLLYTNPLPRMDAVLTQIKESNPDILGAQECSVEWYGFLCRELSSTYGVVGELNDFDGQKWRNPIFYNKDKFELIQTKTNWLSNTPSSFSKPAGTPQYRILTSAVLKDKVTGKTFEYFNTHMDFNEEVKDIQFKILDKLLKKSDYPLLITGDFNSIFGQKHYVTMQDMGYIDSFNLTSDRDSHGTYRDTGNTIDYCFVLPRYINIISHDVLEGTVNGIAPSDHCAVVVEFRLF